MQPRGQCWIMSRCVGASQKSGDCGAWGGQAARSDEGATRSGTLVSSAVSFDMQGEEHGMAMLDELPSLFIGLELGCEGLSAQESRARGRRVDVRDDALRHSQQCYVRAEGLSEEVSHTRTAQVRLSVVHRGPSSPLPVADSCERDAQPCWPAGPASSWIPGRAENATTYEIESCVLLHRQLGIRHITKNFS